MTGQAAGEPRRRLLYVDMAYIVANLRARQQERFLEARHSGGYFEKVWGLHPLADIGGSPARSTRTIRFSPDQVVIEGVARGLGLPRWLLPIDFLVSQAGLILKAARLVRRERIDLVMATDPYYSGLFALIVSRLSRRPLAVAVYANFDELYAATGALAMPRLLPTRGIETTVARTVLRHADLVIAGNDNNLRFGLANGARKRTAVLPVSKYINAIHLTPPGERGSPDADLAALGIPAGAPLLLTIGRLRALKHTDDALRAMAHAMRDAPTVHAIFAGEGELQPELEALARELGVADRVHFPGLVPQEQLARLLPHAITVSPLTGMALVEAGLGGSPVVAYDRDWQADFIEDGTSGFIVPFRDWEALGRAAARLLADPALARRLGDGMRRRALDYADPEILHARERDTFEALLAARPA